MLRLVALAALVLGGCTTMKVPPTKAQYRGSLANKDLSMKQRQKIWQEMKKQYPEGCGEAN
ncbi:MAG: hypothetical protein WC455_22550 [Dehalococcoidia bacterium]